MQINKLKIISIFVFIIAALNFFSISVASPYDLTLIGPISQESICKFTDLWVEHLHTDCSINIIPTWCNLAEASAITKKIVERADKSPGLVTVLFENLWRQDYDATQWLPRDASIKFAYSMIESTKIPQPWTDLLNTKFDAVLVPDEFLVEVYKSSGVTIPIFVLPCALDFTNLLHRKPRTDIHPFIFGMSSAFWTRKNHKIILEAFAQEFGNNPDVLLKMHGRGGYYNLINELETIKNEYHLNNAQIICDKLSNQQFHEFMTNLNCYILISMGEGFSISPREAMALGIPCILSNNTAHKTICSSGLVLPVETLIQQPADYIEAFGPYDAGYQFNGTIKDVRTAMREMYNNYHLYWQKAQKARSWVMQYSFDALKKKHLTLVKPKKIVWGTEDRIEDDCLITSSYKLYEKYKKLVVN